MTYCALTQLCMPNHTPKIMEVFSSQAPTPFRDKNRPTHSTTTTILIKPVGVLCTLCNPTDELYLFCEGNETCLHAIDSYLGVLKTILQKAAYWQHAVPMLNSAKELRALTQTLFPRVVTGHEPIGKFKTSTMCHMGKGLAGSIFFSHEYRRLQADLILNGETDLKPSGFFLPHSELD